MVCHHDRATMTVSPQVCRHERAAGVRVVSRLNGN